ncbi:MAG: hemH [Gammaproteobacteria bacterium]|nr:hemH [Gammaproteobacteria bacterium]
MTTYSGITDYPHQQPAATGILLTNLGTPDAPTTAAVRKYLAEFLSDPRVIELPRLLWWPILHGIILRTRPQRSAHAYQKIWTDKGSPLLDISRRQLQAIQKQLPSQLKGPVRIELAMRYGNPSIKHGLEKLRQANVQRLLVFPLYPQYSAASTGTTFDAVAAVLKTWRWVPELRLLNLYHDDVGYIETLVSSIRDHWAGKGRSDRLLFSFHGLPQQYFLAGDPYFCQCQKTARLVVEQLQLADGQWQIAFQSRFGFQKWLQPYTDKTLKAWGKQGIKSVDVICPGFSADCLETLEEIQLQNRDFFLNSGGTKYSYIPALNDQPAHIDVLTKLIIRNCQGWPEFAPDYDTDAIRAKLQQQEQRAIAMKNTL